MRKPALLTVLLLILGSAVLGTAWADSGDESQGESVEPRDPRLEVPDQPEVGPPGVLVIPDHLVPRYRNPHLRSWPQPRACLAQSDPACAAARRVAEMPPCLKREGCQAYQAWIELNGPPAIRKVPSESLRVWKPVLVSNPAPAPEPVPEPTPKPKEDE